MGAVTRSYTVVPHPLSYPRTPVQRSCYNAGHFRLVTARKSCGAGRGKPTSRCPALHVTGLWPLFTAIPSAPVATTNYLARQLISLWSSLVRCPDGWRTETEQLQRIRDYLGWFLFDDQAHQRLVHWLTQRATDDLPRLISWLALRICYDRGRLSCQPGRPWKNFVVSITAGVQDDVHAPIAEGLAPGASEGHR